MLVRQCVRGARATRTCCYPHTYDLCGLRVRVGRSTRTHQKRNAYEALAQHARGAYVPHAQEMHTSPACAQCCIFSIVRANFQKYDLYSAPIARALPRYIVPFFKFFKTGKCFKTMLFPVSRVSQKPLAFQKHSLLLIQPKTHAKTLSERSEKCATVQVLTDENSVARATYLQRALGALWRALYQV